jgi:hypothetical protein
LARRCLLLDSGHLSRSGRLLLGGRLSCGGRLLRQRLFHLLLLDRGGTTAVLAPAADATGAAYDIACVVFPAALASSSASFMEGGSMDIVSFTGLRALRVFFFFLGLLCSGARIRWWQGRK